jgi:predicted amidohydrolase
VIAAAAARGADLVCFPELYLHRYNSAEYLGLEHLLPPGQRPASEPPTLTGPFTPERGSAKLSP